jgi:glycosyltransferase involved in cell wall biosynthesis
MANYNKERFLTEAVQSVLGQTIADIELIVVDDASTDGSRKILDAFAKKDSRIKLLLNKTNMGPSYSRNRALKIATGRYICFVDSDDIICAERLEKMMDAIVGKPNHIAYTHICLIDENGNTIRKIPRESRNFPPEGKARDHILKEWIWASSTFMIPSSAVGEVGYFDESLRWGEDLNYLIRLTERFKLCIIQEPLYSYRWHKNRTTALMSPATKDQADIKILESVLKQNWNSLNEATRYWIIVRILRTHRLLHIRGKVRWLLSPFFIRTTLQSQPVFDIFVHTIMEDLGELYHKVSI